MHKKRTRLLSLLLTLCLLLAMLPVTAAAAGTMTLTIGTVSGAPGSTVKVKLDITDNPGLASLKVKVAYDDTILVLQIIALFYVPGIQRWFSWPSGESGRMMAVCVAFIINYACYFSEIYRGGIQGVPKGQQEAGQVLGMTKSQIFRHITLLQMIKRIVPPISNEIITLVKDTSLARVIALQEVIWMGESFMKGNSGIAGLTWPLFFTAVYYLIFSGIVTVLLGKLEKKLDFFQ